MVTMGEIDSSKCASERRRLEESPGGIIVEDGDGGILLIGPGHRMETVNDDDYDYRWIKNIYFIDFDGLDDGTEILNDNNRKPGRSETVDLTDNSLIVDISDALSEKDKVKFTVHTKTTLPEFQKPEFLVVRQHEEFVWLHDRFEENEEYAGFIIPPAPPRPDFDASREKLQKLGEGEGTMTKEEFNKMKQELEAEYLATFKKTVAMHEVFLCRLAHHPVFRNDHNFRVFLEYDQDLCVRGKNKMEVIGGFMKSFSKTTDELLLSATVKDVNDFFEQEKNFLIEYHTHLKDATAKADRMTKRHKDVADSYIKISSGLVQLSTIDNSDLEKFLTKVAETFEKARAEVAQQQACDKFEQMSDKAKEELMDFKTRRVAAFRKNLIDTAELELKHAKAQVQLFKNCLGALKEE
uniref:Sorting nexin n=1 Tax=Timema douglasi TaxID=61478 RepID=A0A7R8Z5Y0_TIMDO|nr:unnamed protein product [Timema douglasi]